MFKYLLSDFEAITKLRPWLQLIFRLFLGGLFVFSGWSKTLDVYAFQTAIAGYGIVPVAFLPIMAKALPWIEVLAGGYLMLGLFTRWAASGIAAMLVVFLAAISWALITGQDIDCGCFFGAASEPVSIKKWLEDFVLLGLAVYLAWEPLKKWALDNYLSKSKA